jgi:hypothetical protein
VSDLDLRDGGFNTLLTDLFRQGNDDETIAEWLNDHYQGDAPVIIQLLIQRVRRQSSVLADQLREWAGSIEGDGRPVPEEAIVAGMREVARDIDPERSP